MIMVEQPHQHLLLLVQPALVLEQVVLLLLVQLALERPVQPALVLEQVVLLLLVQPAVVDKQLHLLLLVQPALEVGVQHQLVPRQPEHVQQQQVHFLLTTHIHLIQVPRTVSIVIVFVMLGLIITPTAKSALLPRTVMFVTTTGGGTHSGRPTSQDVNLVQVIIKRSILAVRTVPLLTFTQEQPPR
jgi:hypothetical protein